MLRRGEIFFASPSELNDANECRPRLVLTGSVELWQRLAHLILLEVCVQIFDPFERLETSHTIQNWSNPIGKHLSKKTVRRDLGIEELPNVFSEALQVHLPTLNERRLESSILALSIEYIHHLPRLIWEDKYIASFSKDVRNPTMWGHYADAEKGYAVIYKTEDGKLLVHSPIKVLHGYRRSESSPNIMEVGVYKEESLMLHPVRYSNKLPKVNAFHGLIPHFHYSEEEYHYDVPDQLPGDAPLKQLDDVGLVKYSDWRYEREIRAFFPAYTKLAPDIRALAVDRNHIVGIIFGPKMSKIDKERAIMSSYVLWQTAAVTSGSPFGFFQAAKGVDKFAFKIVPVGILRQFYYERMLPIDTLDKCDEATVALLANLAREIEYGERRPRTKRSPSNG
ncbi:DUF2971 domain-containing protein [Verrucomicrobium sp. BvORR034]|uniref:DUF2971 domain-containing protein n=1 Tax=Verrucomicrobium sp. BvORR034 TaxID=1396418 RepID=UPI000AD01AE6|nr:DUF2971 domain-containing protein [Verrucomicrobium sp. BvORR034]